MHIIYSLFSVIFVSLLSLLGVLFLVLNGSIFNKIITYTLAVSTGVLLGSVFLDLLPESIEAVQDRAFPAMLIGIVLFFILEKLIHWHHHIEGDQHDEKPVALLSLIGDGIHNFVDGAVIATAFITSLPLGITTTIAVVVHEVPHELSDFTILVHSGYSNKKALIYNFISATTAILGTLAVLFATVQIEELEKYLLPFAAGNFLYIASSDLIPELHKKRDFSTSVVQLLLLVAGIFVVPFIQSLF